MDLKQLPIIKIEKTTKLDESDLQEIKKRIYEDLKFILESYITNYHFDNEDVPDDLEGQFKDNWHGDFEYMIDYYPNLIEEDHPEIQKQFILDWSNNKI
jgi:hypothetical protein